MTAPTRIQRRRTKGWRMPEGAIYVGRPTIWGNPFDWREWREAWPFGSPTPDPGRDTIDRDTWCKERAAEEYRLALLDGSITLPVAELRGRTLACWCPLNRACHADTLLEIANA
jgi:hypothetical protein